MKTEKERNELDILRVSLWEMADRFEDHEYGLLSPLERFIADQLIDLRLLITNEHDILEVKK